jgi:hypothetical protein
MFQEGHLDIEDIDQSHRVIFNVKRTDTGVPLPITAWLQQKK